MTFRFNLFRSVEITGISGPGYSSGQALAALEEVFASRPCRRRWVLLTQACLTRKKSRPPAGPTFVLAIVFVFLLLAAMYESWRLPWAVLLGSPLVALGSFFGVWLMGYDNNVYVQIGNVMLIGLAAKNAILIVEVAKAKHEEGMSIEEAALGIGALRFRPILMTAFAFILGVVPLDDRERSGCGRAERHGYRRLLGNVGRYGAGSFPHPWQLRVRRGPGEKAENGPGDGSCRAITRGGALR